MQKNQTVFGLMIIAVAIIVLLANINVGFARELIASWWPLLIVAAGLYTLWQGRENYTWGMVLTAIGVSLLISTLGILGLSLGDVILPILMLAIGLAVLAGSFNRTGTSRRQTDKSDDSISAILSGVSSRNSSKDYRGGSVNAVMGGAEIDLSRARIKQEAFLQVWVLMGGINLRVPDGVTVKQRTTNILGGIEDKTIAAAGSGEGPTLYIDGTVTMGGIEINN